MKPCAMLALLAIGCSSPATPCAPESFSPPVKRGPDVFGLPGQPLAAVVSAPLRLGCGGQLLTPTSVAGAVTDWSGERIDSATSLLGLEGSQSCLSRH